MIDLARITRDVETTDRWEAEGITDPLTRAEIDRRELLKYVRQLETALRAYACLCDRRDVADPEKHGELCTYRTICCIARALRPSSSLARAPQEASLPAWLRAVNPDDTTAVIAALGAAADVIDRLQGTLRDIRGHSCLSAEVAVKIDMALRGAPPQD